MNWRRKALRGAPGEAIQSGRGACFVWHSRLPNLKERAFTESSGAVVTLYTVHVTLGATLGDRFAHGAWSRGAADEGVSRIELRVLRCCHAEW